MQSLLPKSPIEVDPDASTIEGDQEHNHGHGEEWFWALEADMFDAYVVLIYVLIYYFVVLYSETSN